MRGAIVGWLKNKKKTFRVSYRLHSGFISFLSKRKIDLHAMISTFLNSETGRELEMENFKLNSYALKA